MSQSKSIQKQIDDLTVCLNLAADNRDLQMTLNSRINSLNNVLTVVLERESYEAERDAAKARLLDPSDAKAKKVQGVVDDLGDALDESGKIGLRDQIRQLAVADDTALDTYRYMKQAGWTNKQIKLVLGL